MGRGTQKAKERAAAAERRKKKLHREFQELLSILQNTKKKN